MLVIAFLTLLQFFLASATKPDDPQEYQCHKTSDIITIDGKADETAWNRAEKAVFVSMDGHQPRLKTEFMWLWDNKNLYGFFHIEDDNLWATMKKRDDHLWTENVVEFFIDPDGCSKTYAEFEFNPLNTILDLYILNKYNSRRDIRQLWEWNCDSLQSAVVVKGTLNYSGDRDEGWDLEVALPFSQFYTAPNIPPMQGDEWKADFCRGEGEEKPGKPEYSAWAPPAFHNPLSYGIFKFVEP